MNGNCSTFSTLLDFTAAQHLRRKRYLQNACCVETLNGQGQKPIKFHLDFLAFLKPVRCPGDGPGR